MELPKKLSFQKNIGMKLNTKIISRIQLGTTVFIISMMCICMVVVKEFYPFAPYTMYSHVHDIAYQRFMTLFCKVSGDEVLLNNAMTDPFDEARLEMSMYASFANMEELKNKLNDLRSIVKNNNFSCDQTILKITKYSNAEEFLKKNGKIVYQVDGDL